jgi:hypothetical protein
MQLRAQGVLIAFLLIIKYCYICSINGINQKLRLSFMSTIQIRLYDIFRKNLKLHEPEAKELVEVIQEVSRTEQAEKHKHLEQMVQKDIKLLKEHMDFEFVRVAKEFGYMKDYMDSRFATKEDLAKDLAAVKAELSRTIYLTSLGQLVAIIASVISIVMILKK